MKKIIAWVLSLAMIFAILPVNILAVSENEIQAISVDDLYIVKSNAYYSEKNGDVYNIYNLLGYYRPYYVSYTDGSSTPVYGPYAPDEDTWVDLLTTCSVPCEEWEVGNTYDITATLLGVSDTFRVTVLEIESVTVGNVVCIQNHTGSWDGYWDGYGNYVENAWFKYDVYPGNITIDFTDGTSISGDASKIAEYIGYYPNFYSDQSYENQWDIGMYSATFNVAGYANTYAVEVVETPIERILVDDITYCEGTNGWKEYSEDNAQWYYYDINPKELTVVLKNGTELSGSLNEVCEQLGCWQNCTSDQSYENQWGIGEHKATIDLLGVTTEYKIIITDSPVDSLEIEDIEIIVGTKGYYNGDWYYYSSFWPDFTVTLADGKTVSVNGSSGVTIDGEWYSLSIDKSGQYDEHWTVGNTYEVTGTLKGVTDTFNVTIVEAPVKSIDISDISIIEGTKGYDNGRWYYYNSICPIFTVTLKNGETVSATNGSSGIIIDGEWYYLNIDNSAQDDEPWVVGSTYTVTGTFMGVSDTFDVTIVPGPIEKIVFEDVVLYEGIDSNDWYDYPYYHISAKPSEVLLKNGETAEIRGNNVIYNGEYYYTDNNYQELQAKEHWTAGNTYQVTGKVLGASATLNVTILENPIQKLEIVKSPNSIDCLAGSTVDLTGAIIRIRYTDGTYEDVNIKYPCCPGYYPDFYSEKIDRSSDISLDGEFGSAGLQTATLTIFRKTVVIPVNVQENLAESITIKEDKDKSIILKVNNADGTSYDMRLLDICYMDQWDYGTYSTHILTDKGQFAATIYSDESGFAIGLGEYGSEKIIKSNVLPFGDWFTLNTYLYDYMTGVMYSNRPDFENFTGEITKENIETVLVLTGRLTGFSEYEHTIHGGSEFLKIPGEDMKAAVGKLFAVEDIDLTLSKNYDPQTDIYLYEPAYGGSGRKPLPNLITYNNGIWSIKTYLGTDDGPADITDLKYNMHLQFNDDLRITSLVVGESVVPETPVCSVTSNGEETVTYDSLEEALAETTSGTIKLLMDATADTILLKPDVTLDLNGYTLTADSVIVFNGAAITDGGNNCTGGGLLKVPEENLGFMRENGQGVIPVWNGVDGYVFTKVSYQQLAMAAGSGAAQYIFLPTFSNAEASALMADGGVDNGVQIKVSLNWGNGQSQQFYTYSDDLVQKVFDGTGRWVFSLTVTGISGITDMTASAVVVTDCGAQSAATGTTLIAG